MKVQPVMTMFSVAISALLGYVIYCVCDDGDSRMLLSILSGVSILLILFSGTGIKYYANSDASIKILSTVFAVISFGSGLILSFTAAKTAAIIITSSAIMLIYLLIFYLIPKSNV